MTDVTVIIAVYKEPLKYLKSAIRSIQSQSLRDFNVVVILDDPYNLAADKYLREVLKVDRRFQYFKNEANIGLARSLNRALEVCSTKYIARMDADDISEPRRLSKQFSYLEKNPKIALLGAGISLIDDDGSFCGKRNINGGISVLSKTVNYKSICFHPTWMVRSEIYAALNGYKNLTRGQDFDFLIRTVKAGFCVYNLADLLVRYRVYNNRLDARSLRCRMCNHIEIKESNRLNKHVNVDDTKLWPYELYLIGQRQKKWHLKLLYLLISASGSHVIFKYLLGLVFARFIEIIMKDD